MNLRSILVLGVGRVLQLAIVFVTFRFLTTLLPVKEVGFFFLLQSLSGFVILAGISPVGSFVAREINNWRLGGHLNDGLFGFAGLTLAIALLAAIGFGFIHFSGLTSWSNYASLPLFMGALFVSIAGAAMANTYIPLFNILGFSQLFVLISVGTQLVAFAASVGVASYLTNYADAVSWISATGTIQLAFGFVAYKILSTRESKQASVEAPAISRAHRVRRIFSTAPAFSAPLIAANIAVWCLIQGYRPMIESLKGLEFLAYVGLGMGLASSISAAFEALLHQIFLPKFYRSLDDRSEVSYAHSWNDFWQNVFPVYIGFTIVLAGLSKQFVSVLANGKYANAWIYLSIGALAEFFRMAGNIVVFYTQGERKTRTTLAPYWMGAGIALAGSAYSATTNRLEGVAVSVVAGQFVATAWMLFRVSKLSKRKISIGLPLMSALRFTLVPAVLVFAVYKLEPVWSIGIAGIVMTGLTAHYWWVRSRDMVTQQVVP
ncbi:hypothetical protein BH10BDE1_BH10BDE1_35350 [soil metagenome]